MATDGESVRLWDPDGGSLDFDGWCRWICPRPNMPGEIFSDNQGDETLILSPDPLKAQGHPGRCVLLFFLHDLQALTADGLRELHEWLDEFIRAKRSTMVAYVRQVTGDDLLKVFAYRVDAVSYPGPLIASLLGPQGGGMPDSERVLQIEFICSAWGTVNNDDWDLEPDFDAEHPEVVTVLWRRAQ